MVLVVGSGWRGLIAGSTRNLTTTSEPAGWPAGRVFKQTTNQPITPPPPPLPAQSIPRVRRRLQAVHDGEAAAAVPDVEAAEGDDEEPDAPVLVGHLGRNVVEIVCLF